MVPRILNQVKSKPSASCPGGFTPAETARGVHWVRVFVWALEPVYEETKSIISALTGNRIPII